MPSCFGLSASVRTRQNIMSAKCAPEVQIFWPLMTKSSPSTVGTRLERRQIGAGIRLGIALAPDHLAAQRRRDPLLPLLLGASLQQRRHQHGNADAAHRRRHAAFGKFLGDDARLQRIGLRAVAAILLWDGAAGIAVREQELLPGQRLRSWPASLTSCGVGAR